MYEVSTSQSDSLLSFISTNHPTFLQQPFLTAPSYLPNWCQWDCINPVWLDIYIYIYFFVSFPRFSHRCLYDSFIKWAILSKVNGNYYLLETDLCTLIKELKVIMLMEARNHLHTWTGIKTALQY